MTTALAIRHVAFEDLGSIHGLLRDRYIDVRTLDAGVDDLSTIDPLKADLLIVLGGPISANDEDAYPFLTDELKILEARLAADKPTLGICLGAQLIARVLGSKVYPTGTHEIGWMPVTLTEAGRTSPLAHLEDIGGQVLHWHGDTFDLPDGTERLASTEVAENQAFSKGASVLGLQFHLEVNPSALERWLIGHAVELGMAKGTDPVSIRKDTKAVGANVAEIGAMCFDDWLTNLDLD